jgi:UDP-N-acetylglucosamine:LPS N-acetylglucosamine transferase
MNNQQGAPMLPTKPPSDDSAPHDASRAPRVLAIASGGGHWVQLLRMRPAWGGCDAAYATTHPDYVKDLDEGQFRGASRFYTFADANRWQKLRLIRQLLEVLFIVLKERPDVIISTGASAGYFAIRIGKLLGCRTIWVDSIANAEELSLAGRRVGPFADLWLTQWAHLRGANPDNGAAPRHYGAVL